MEENSLIQGTVANRVCVPGECNPTVSTGVAPDSMGARVDLMILLSTISVQ